MEKIEIINRATVQTENYIGIVKCKNCGTVNIITNNDTEEIAINCTRCREEIYCEWGEELNSTVNATAILPDISDLLIAWEQFKKTNWYKSDAVECDRYYNPDNFSTKKMVITCLDQVPENIPTTIDGNSGTVKIEEIGDYCGIKHMFPVYSETSFKFNDDKK